MVKWNKEIQFTSIEKKEKQQVFKFEKLESDTFGHFGVQNE